MTLRRFLPRMAPCLLGVIAFAGAHASTYNYTGNFAADNSFLELQITTATMQNLDISTTSYASGGFVPVLTLFDAAGNPVDNNGSGTSDAMLNETDLAAGTYDLFLTELPNVAVGNLSDGFLFAGDPTATGDNCGVSGGMFLDSISCAQLSSAYALDVVSSGTADVTTVSQTPEPSSLLLMVVPLAAGAVLQMRRRHSLGF